MLLKSLSKHQKKYSVFNRFVIFEAPKSVLLTVCAILLASVSCLYSSSGGNFEPWAFKQVIFIIISLVVFYAIISLNVKIFYKFSYISMFCVVILLLMVIPFGKRVLGASRWLDFGVFMVQPSEYAKVAVILVLAKFFSNINVKILKKLSTTVIAFTIILPIFILVFIIGHVLNLFINALGAYVHTNRLQFVEFFGKFYDGGGRPIEPFTQDTKYVEVKEEM